MWRKKADSICDLWYTRKQIAEVIWDGAEASELQWSHMSSKEKIKCMPEGVRIFGMEICASFSAVQKGSKVLDWQFGMYRQLRIWRACRWRQERF